MPIYEYVCGDCSEPFEALVQDVQEPTCPSCGSETLEKQVSVFAVKGGTGVPASMEAPGPCGTCGDPRGAGSCSL